MSIRPFGQAEFGTRREIKNLNSFRFLEQAINAEIRYQTELIEDGGKVQQATVLFDPDSGETRAMRSKEDAHDYRYFPDPDLLPLKVSDAEVDAIRADMPELPGEMKQRFIDSFAVSAYDAGLLTQSLALARYFEAAAQACPGQGKLVANWVNGDLAARLNAKKNPSPTARCPPNGWPAWWRAWLINTFVQKAGQAGVRGAVGQRAERRRGDRARRPRSRCRTSAPSKTGGRSPRRQPQGGGRIPRGRKGAERAGRPGDEGQQGKANPAQVQDILRQKLAG